MKKKILLFTTIVVCSFLMILQIVISQKISSVGANLKKMQSEIDTVGIENELLKSEIATTSSLISISQKANSIGFKNATYFYLDIPPVALNK